MRMIKKIGFTLAETLIAMVIIGVVVALSIPSLKSVDKKAYKYQYMSAYTALSKAYYNGLINGYNPFRETPDANGVTLVHDAANDTGTETLCKGLTSFINTTTNVKTASVDYNTSCSATKLATSLATPADFAYTKVQFIANNGMKFYLTGRLGDGNLENGMYFYIVYVDINGSKKPNSFDYDRDADGKVTSYPDIHAFAVLSTGNVIPIGYAEFDPTFLTSRIAYFNNDGDVLYTKKSLAYYQAKGLAWGYYSSIANPEETYDESEPHSLNDFIRNKIDDESNIVKNLPAVADLSPEEVASDAVHNCSAEDFDSCYLFLDEYR